MEIIKKWLSGKRNYHVGVVLYKQFGKDEKLKKFFEGSPTPIKIASLLKALESLQDKPSVSLVTKKESPEGSEMPDSPDEVLMAFKKEWLPLYTRMQYLRYELDRLTGKTKNDNAQRYPIAKEILDLEQKCMQIWERRDHYITEGKLPEDVKPIEEELPVDWIQLGLLLETTKRNLRRNKQMAAEHPSKPLYAIKAKQYAELLQRILTKIEDDKRNNKK